MRQSAQPHLKRLKTTRRARDPRHAWAVIEIRPRGVTFKRKRFEVRVISTHKTSLAAAGSIYPDRRVVRSRYVAFAKTSGPWFMAP